jgi:hypothetical protein
MFIILQKLRDIKWNRCTSNEYKIKIIYFKTGYKRNTTYGLMGVNAEC